MMHLVFDVLTINRSNKKGPHSSSRHSGGSLETVAEEDPWQFADPNFELSRLSENGPTPDQGKWHGNSCLLLQRFGYLVLPFPIKEPKS